MKVLQISIASLYQGLTIRSAMPETFGDQISEYRKSLLSLQQQMQSEYDKAILALSGGALGISLTFLKDIVVRPGSSEIRTPGFLLLAWVCWGASATCILFSYFTSASALEKAVAQTDTREIYITARGGLFNTVTRWLNAFAGLFFLFGVILLVFFTYKNLK